MGALTLVVKVVAVLLMPPPATTYPVGQVMSSGAEAAPLAMLVPKGCTSIRAWRPGRRRQTRRTSAAMPKFALLASCVSHSVELLGAPLMSVKGARKSVRTPPPATTVPCGQSMSMTLVVVPPTMLLPMPSFSVCAVSLGTFDGGVLRQSTSTCAEMVVNPRLKTRACQETEGLGGVVGSG